MRNIFLNWQMNNTFGWGILGFNLFSQFVKVPDVRPLMGMAIDDLDLVMVDPLRRGAILSAMMESNQFLATMKRDSGGMARIKGTVIDSLGDDIRGNDVHGQSNIGRIVYADTRLPDARQALSRYDALLCGSEWNAQCLHAATGREVKVILEGVDTSLFCPGTRSGVLDPGKFYIFTGGKIEARKGQDLTLMAFRAFSARHPDAVLVTSWQSPWPQWAAGFKGRLEHGVKLSGNGTVDVKTWARDNGVDPNKVIDLGHIPNQMMPTVLRDIDVCLQPSRAEPCTSLPVKEAMACGAPVIAAANTGMLDILTSENSIALKHQAPVPGAGTEGWGESSIDEIVETLEWVYRNRAEARLLGRRAAQWIVDERRTWQAHADDLLGWIQATFP
ncbi:glycosyltransferase family 4 protein [Achromobacter aloeverae]